MTPCDYTKSSRHGTHSATKFVIWREGVYRDGPRALCGKCYKYMTETYYFSFEYNLMTEDEYLIVKALES